MNKCYVFKLKKKNVQTILQKTDLFTTWKKRKKIFFLSVSFENTYKLQKQD